MQGRRERIQGGLGEVGAGGGLSRNFASGTLPARVAARWRKRAQAGANRYRGSGEAPVMLALSQLAVEMSAFSIPVRPESFDTLRYSGPTGKPAQQRIEGVVLVAALRYAQLYPFILSSPKGVSKDSGRTVEEKMASTANCDRAVILPVFLEPLYLCP
jgi:hypothetical protein